MSDWIRDYRDERGVLIKQRVFMVTDRRGNFLWWEVATNEGQGLGWEPGLSDFSDGEWLGLSADDKRRALKRKSKYEEPV